MRLPVFLPAAVATIALGLSFPAAADPWIAGVKPRLVGRGTTTEVTISQWGHEARGLIFYPPLTGSPKPRQAVASGIRCTGTQYDEGNAALRNSRLGLTNCPPVRPMIE